ncbi:MAG TPA: sugar nucleotide-binding protein [Dongiaceae bacterium]|nr:sugar nucleotide-binding protein [Dongiaceae bacterium]
MIRRHRILVIGRNGQLAKALAATEWPSLTSLHFAGRDEIDLFHPLRLRQQIGAIDPEIIINTAGYARVDLAEQEPEAAFALNAIAVDNLAKTAAMLDLPLIHHSSAHVFAGDKAAPYRENDRTEPTTVYGQSMLAGEAAIRRAHGRHLILRSSRFFGGYGSNFLKTLLALGRSADALEFAANGYACPTPVEALAATIPHIAVAMIEGRRFPSTLHYAGNAAASWYEIAGEVFTLAGKIQPVPAISPAANSCVDGAAPRIWNLALDCSLARSLGLPQINWRASLPATIEALCANDALGQEQLMPESSPAFSLAALHAA